MRFSVTRPHDPIGLRNQIHPSKTRRNTTKAFIDSIKPFHECIKQEAQATEDIESTEGMEPEEHSPGHSIFSMEKPLVLAMPTAEELENSA
jgi:hypothetical protein